MVIIMDCTDLHPQFDQPLNQFQIPTLSSVMQDRRSMPLFQVDISSMVNQEMNQLDISFTSGIMQDGFSIRTVL